MSKTFEVYPGHSHYPLCGDLLSVANKHLSKRLAALNSDLNAQINIELRRCEGDALISLDLSDPLKWTDDFYAWFVVLGVAGGTDVYCNSVDDLTREVWTDHLKLDRLTPLAETVNQCLSVGHYWTFRRSAGQPGIVNLAFSMTAA